MTAKRKKITDLLPSQRPREKLSLLGVANLTDTELLALVLGFGTKRRNVLSLAKIILKTFSIKKLPQLTVADFTHIDGIGSVQAGRILAAIELGRRAFANIPLNKLLTPQDAVREAGDLRTKSQEHLVALYLNARYELIEKHTIGIGGLSKNVIEPRDIFRHAFILPSPFFLLIHNHASGDATPSNDDIVFTKRLVRAGRLLGCRIIDHIIVSGKDYFSFREAKLL
jgi:DNA repair protein RadC